MKLLACPKCHQQLHLENKTLKCENNHCYDISKRGYINLLLNPDKATNTFAGNKLMLNMNLGPVLQKWMRDIKQKYK